MMAKFLRSVIPARWRPIRYLEDLVRTRSKGCVREGPFEGMRYAERSVGSAYIPKLLGIYEKELREVVEEACAHKASLIVDIGAAEGYYAVGMALRNPASRVVAFEMDPTGRDFLHDMARSNAVNDRVEVRGKCEIADLQAVLQAEAAVIICDIEGYEQVLLDPRSVPALRDAAVLVELHEFLVPGITSELTERFAPTHTLRQVQQEPRSRQHFPWHTVGTALLPKSYLDWAVDEWRPVQMTWLWMTPKNVIATP